ncbi:MAG: gas vesicle protein GvpG [Candidatus Methanoperedens sp.]|nr:gas vesicle protein GvpG [Candidatus Methanoperedens sp.]
MFIIDDILLRQLGITIPGLDLIWTLEQIRDFAYREMYNPEKIKNSIKENRLLFEFGEMTIDEYEKTNAKLLQELKLAERGAETNLSVRTDILGAIR